MGNDNSTDKTVVESPKIIIGGIDILAVLPVLKTLGLNVVLIILSIVLIFGYQAKDQQLYALSQSFTSVTTQLNEITNQVNALSALAPNYTLLSNQISQQSTKIEGLDAQVTNLRIQLARITGTDTIATPEPK